VQSKAMRALDNIVPTTIIKTFKRKTNSSCYR